MEATADIMDGRLLAAARPEGLADLFERLTGHRSLGEDLTQEVLRRILRDGPTFQGRQPSNPWRFRIVHLDHRAPTWPWRTS